MYVRLHVGQRFIAAQLIGKLQILSRAVWRFAGFSEGLSFKCRTCRRSNAEGVDCLRLV